MPCAHTIGISNDRHVLRIHLDLARVKHIDKLWGFQSTSAPFGLQINRALEMSFDAPLDPQS